MNIFISAIRIKTSYLIEYSLLTNCKQFKEEKYWKFKN